MVFFDQVWLVFVCLFWNGGKAYILILTCVQMAEADRLESTKQVLFYTCISFIPLYNEFSSALQVQNIPTYISASTSESVLHTDSIIALSRPASGKWHCAILGSAMRT